MIVTKTRTYVTGDTLSASNYNADRDEVIAGVNSIVDAQIAIGAGIAYAKLNLTNSIVNADIVPAAGIPYSKLSLASSVVESDLNLSDNTTNNVSATKHGFAPKFPNNTTTFLRGDGAYAEPPAPTSISVAGIQRVSVYRTSAQAVPHNTSTVIAFTNEYFDTDNMHDNSTNPSRITFNTAGVYFVSASAVWAANGTGRRFSYIRLNGSPIISQCEGGPNTATYAGEAHALMYTFAQGDYIEFDVFQTSGTSVDIVLGQPSHFDAFRVA